MSSKTMGAAEFKAVCLRVLDQMSKDHEPVTITKRGKPIAVLTPISEARTEQTLFGALKGSALHYHDPLAPVGDANDWNSTR